MVLVAVSLRICLSLGVLSDPDRSLTPDGIEYQDFAENITNGQGFVREQVLANGQPIAVPEIFRTPGYPVFLALAERTWPGGGVRLAIWFQVLLGTCSCLLVFAIARQLTDHRLPAVLAGLLLAIDGPSAVHTALLLSETLATFFMAVMLYSGLRFVRGRRLPDLFVAATAFVFGAHVRPVFLTIGLPLLVALLIGAKPRQLIATMLVVGSIIGAGIGGWTLRNSSTAGYGVFSTVNEYALLFHGAGLEALETHGDLDVIMERYRAELARELPPDTKQLDQKRWNHAMRHKALQELQARWTLIPEYTVRNLLRLMTHVDHESFRQVMGHPPAPPSPQAGMLARLQRSTAGVRGLWVVVAAQLFLATLLWIGVFAALVRTVWNRAAGSLRPVVACLLVAAILGLLGSSLPNAQVRFRLSLLPLLLPLATLGIFGGSAPRPTIPPPIARLAGDKGEPRGSL